MRSLMILVATTAVVSGLRDMTPGFTVDFRSFGGSPVYREQRLPDRQQTRSFKETSQPSAQQQLQTFREETFREHRQPFSGREETRIFHEENRGGFKGDTRIYKEENRESFKDELRNFDGEARPFRDETRIFNDEVRSFRDETGPFREERPFTEETRPFRDGPRHFRGERPFRDERRQYRDEIRPYRNEYRTFRDESRPFRDDFRHFEGPMNFRDEIRPFRAEPGPFRNDRPYREESGPLKNGLRPFKEESGPFRNEPRPFREEIGSFGDDRPFREESGPFKNGPRPFTDESRPAKDEILFTQESQSLADAQHRYNKEQEQRQPLSFGGHSNYLKFGNHGLGFASVPAAVLPLQDSSRVAEMMRSELSQTAATQSPGISSPREISGPNNHISVTLAPEVGSTPSQSLSGNTIDGNTVKNQKLADEASTNQASTAVTISTSGETSVTPKVVFGSGSASISNPPMRITNVDSGSGMQQANTASANSLHASKSSMHPGTSTNSYFPSDTTPEVPAALLNYIFKYQVPQETKMRYVYRQSLPSDSFNPIQTVPLVHHHQTTFLPEFKIPALSAIHQPAGTMNYVSTADLPKVSYLNTNSPTLTLGTSYSTDTVPPVNFARNLIQLDQGGQLSHFGQTEQLSQLRPIGQNEQFSHLNQLTSSPNLNQLGHYGQFGQAEQTRSNPFNQGGLQLQLGGFGGIDYSALSSNSETSRASPAVSLGIAKVGLSFPEPPRPPAPAFTKRQPPKPQRSYLQRPYTATKRC